MVNKWNELCQQVCEIFQAEIEEKIGRSLTGSETNALQNIRSLLLLEVYERNLLEGTQTATQAEFLLADLVKQYGQKPL